MNYILLILYMMNDKLVKKIIKYVLSKEKKMKDKIEK